MKYIFSFILAIALTGCAFTWTTVGAAIVTGVTVAEDIAGVATAYREFKKDSNSTTITNKREK